LETTVFNIVLYGCETWTYDKKIRDKLLTFEMYCYRRILSISWTERKTNREICDKLRIENDLLQKATESKLRLFGHICRLEDNRKLKTLMFGIVDGMNKRGSHVESGWTTFSADVRLDYKSCTVWSKITEDGNSL